MPDATPSAPSPAALPTSAPAGVAPSGTAVVPPPGADPASLVLVAERHNPLRSFLLVSTVLAKHVPVAGSRCRLSGLALALAVAGDPRAGGALRTLHGGDALEAARAGAAIEAAPARTADAVVVIGFAETATGLTEQVASGLDADWWQTTTRRTEGTVGLPFDEAHSHAPDQWIVPPAGGWRDGLVVLVDDEFSTGATAARLIEQLHGVSPRARYVLAALVDSRPEGPGPLEELAERLGVVVDVVALERRPPGVYPPAGWSGGALPVAATGPVPDGAAELHVEVPSSAPPQHAGQDRDGRREHVATALRAAEAVGSLGADALVLGTGEHLAIAQRAAATAGALVSSTTRSPVLVTATDGYPIAAGLAFDNPDGPGIAGFAYNVRAAERSAVVVHFPDPAHRDRGGALLDALRRDGARRIVTVTTT